MLKPPVIRSPRLARILGHIRSLRASAPSGRVLRALAAACLALSVAGGVLVRPVTSGAAGRLYYVATTGSDTTGDGSQARPWATIQKASNTMASGDIVHVAPGTYAAFSVARAGTSSAYTQFIADGAVTISGGTHGIQTSADYVRIQGFTVTGSSSDGVLADGADYLQLVGVTITRSGHDGIHAWGAKNVVISGCTVANNGYAGMEVFDANGYSISGTEVYGNATDGIVISGINNTIENCVVHSQTSLVTHGDGIVIQNPAYAPWGPNTDHTVVRDTVLYDNTQNFYPDAFGPGAITNTYFYDNIIYHGVIDQQGISVDPEGANIDGLWILDNTIVGIDGGGGQGISFGARSGYSLNNIVVKNNLMYNSHLQRNSGTVTNAVVDYNLYYRNSSGMPYVVSWNGAQYSTVSAFRTALGYEAHGVQADPLFVNMSARDYHVQLGSPAIAAGIGPALDPAVPVTDMDGVTRSGSTTTIGAYERGGTLPPPDTTAPVVSITSPASGATVSGSVALAAAASDNIGVTRVEFRVDGALVASDAAAPYTASWNAANASAGTHTITATAYDAAGNSTVASVSVNVATPADTTPPSVAITSPNAGATVSGSVALAASAADNVGVTRVEFRVDGALIASDSTAPYVATWNASTAAAGGHTVVVTAYDAAGNSSSASEDLFVPDTTAPAVAITAPAASSTVTGSVALAASASDDVGVAYVEFRVDGVLIGDAATPTYTGTLLSSPAAPYTVTWDASKASPGAHTITATAYDAAGNSTTSSEAVTVLDTTAPSVSITSPAAGASVSGTVSVSATAVDNVGVTRVEFRVDDVLLSTDADAPYTAVWDASAAGAGTHTITATAFDAAGNSTVASVSVKVPTLRGKRSRTKFTRVTQ